MSEETTTVTFTRQTNPAIVCPYCADQAPYGDERNQWIDAHLNSLSHRAWYALKRRLKR